MANMRKKLETSGLLSRMVAGPAVQAILTGLEIVREGPQGLDGDVTFGLVEKLGFLDLDLIAPPSIEERAFYLAFEEEAGTRIGFRLAV